VTREVPDHALVAGNPARRIGWVCACGRRLADAGGTPVGGRHRGHAVCPADGSRYGIEGDACRSLPASPAHT
jgi:UDP-2-acetamido-3-amino-2,3-dideoxy-glucuronate N-acetyltransferase